MAVLATALAIGALRYLVSGDALVADGWQTVLVDVVGLVLLVLATGAAAWLGARLVPASTSRESRAALGAAGPLALAVIFFAITLFDELGTPPVGWGDLVAFNVPLLAGGPLGAWLWLHRTRRPGTSPAGATPTQEG